MWSDSNSRDIDIPGMYDIYMQGSFDLEYKAA